MTSITTIIITIFDLLQFSLLRPNRLLKHADLRFDLYQLRLEPSAITIYLFCFSQNIKISKFWRLIKRSYFSLANLISTRSSISFAFRFCMLAMSWIAKFDITLASLFFLIKFFTMTRFLLVLKSFMVTSLFPENCLLSHTVAMKDITKYAI